MEKIIEKSLKKQITEELFQINNTNSELLAWLRKLSNLDFNAI